ncbi:MAG: stage 0 sporulation family protein [Nitrospirae bacterium]|nr:stage 0 sporulation family protein [Nitrospirota bacterium]
MSVSVNDRDESGVETRPVVGVRFKPCGKIYSFDPGGLELRKGDKVVVESMFGLTIGTVVLERVEPRPEKGDSPDEKGERKGKASKELKPVVRKATEEDIQTAENNRELEDEARRHCLERIAARGLPMKLVCTEATLDRKRIIFYFTADGRIDFRELVKDLASKFRTRIEMRQIGVRDESKLIGGIGVCGREFCCRTFLTNFAPISIRMAKEQELVLNAAKLSGVCGRLMCCLSYEYDEWQPGQKPEEETVAEDPMEGCLCGDCSAEGAVDSLLNGDVQPVQPGKAAEEAGGAGKERRVNGEGYKEKRRRGRGRRSGRQDGRSGGAAKPSVSPPDGGMDVPEGTGSDAPKAEQPDASRSGKKGSGKKKRPYFTRTRRGGNTNRDAQVLRHYPHILRKRHSPYRACLYHGCR